MNQVPAKQESNLPSVPAQPQQDQILQSDIMLPKVLLQQALSDLVKKRKAQSGDLCRSTDGEILGNEKTPLEFIPLTFQNLWMLSEDEKGKGDKKDFKFRGYEPRDAKNEAEEWDFMQDGVRWKRTKVMSLYALLVRDIEKTNAAIKAFQETQEMPDLDAALMPVVIQFRNTSFKAAKDVVNLFMKAADLAFQMGVDVPVYGRTMNLEVRPEQKDNNDYFVLRATPNRPTPKEFLTHCNRWRNTLIAMGNTVKVDESDVAGTQEPGAEPFNNQF
jgi:hypothetical protein